MSVINLLSSDGYIVCNKTLIRMFGANCAILIGELCAEYNYFKEKGELTPENSFYSTQANIEYNTGLSEYDQRKALKTLQEEGIISVTKKGMPAKNYYQICEDKLLNIFSTSPLNFKGQVVQNFNLNNNKKINNIKNNIINNNYLENSEDSNALFSVSDKLYDDKPKGKKNLYQKCIDEINSFTDSDQLRMELKDYLRILLDIYRDKGKTLYTNVFKNRLNTLATLSDNVDIQCRIVHQASCYGWQTFYPLKDAKGKKDISITSAEYGNVNNNKIEEEFVDEDF